jgi:glycosyltransferase involved in cell wall biosynthesis
MPSPVRALVFTAEPGDRYRVGRTLRSLKGLGLVPEELDASQSLGDGPVWLMRAGAWARAMALTLPPASASGRSLCALGHAHDNEAWAALQADSGGDLSHLPDLAARLPPVVSAYLDGEAAASLSRRLSEGGNLSDALRAEIATGRHRVVRFAPLDVHADDAFRVVQLVTSLQRGGAERVAIDLHRHLGWRGVRSLLAVLGRPTRAPFPAPPGTLDLSAIGGREARVEAAHRAALGFAADVIHAHLLRGEELARLSSRGIPVVATVHNTRPGWPTGLDGLRPGDASLLLACSQAVEADVRAARLPVPVRTAWNGIDFIPFAPTAGPRAAERHRLDLSADDFVLLALANPRPQKRLDRLPAIVAATRARLPRRTVRLVIAGEASATDEAARCVAAVRAEAARLGLGDHVRMAGAADNVPTLLAAADVLVSASLHEGLSLALLEALAAGLPVVATDAGGTSEVALANPAVNVLALEASADDFAEVLARLAEAPAPNGRDAAAVHFTTARMVERHAWLYPRAVEAARGPRRGEGLVLVINNLSTGGAQSSARRLLLGLAADGVRVRAAVLQERPDRPTPGRLALRAAGVEVFAAPPPEDAEPAVATASLIEWIDADLPAAVLFWNALAQHKVLLADALLDVPVFDVSPGEMYFESLERYFARPRPGLPYRTARDFGARLAGVIVKYRAEADLAARLLEAPVHVIPNGVALSPLPCAHGKGVEGEGSGRLVIGTSARISPRKRLEALLAAVRLAHPHLPPYVLRIAGGVERGCDEYAAELSRRGHGLTVEWVGECDDVRPFLAGLDLFAMISEPAGCPNASLEAMAAGLPVVATDFGGAGEQVIDGVTGRLVPPRDAAALAAALVDLAHAPGRRGACGAAGRARAEALFDLRRMVADYRRVCLG